MSLFAAMSHPVPLLAVSVRIVVGRLLCLVPSSPSSSCLSLLAVRIHLSVSPPRQTNCSMEAETLDSFSIRFRLSGCRGPALRSLCGPRSGPRPRKQESTGTHSARNRTFSFLAYSGHTDQKSSGSRVLETGRSLALALRGAQITGEPWRKRTVGSL